MNRLSNSLFTLALALIPLIPLSAAAVSVTATPSSPTPDPFSVLEVALVASGLGEGTAPSVGAFDLDLAYDDSILSLTSVTFGDPGLGNQLDLVALGSLNGSTPGSGTVNLFEVSLDSVTDLHALQADSFALATLTFQTLAPGTSSLDLTGVGLSDALGALLPATLVSGNVNVIPEPSTALLIGLGLLGLGARKRAQPPFRSAMTPRSALDPTPRHSSSAAS